MLAITPSLYFVRCLLGLGIEDAISTMEKSASPIKNKLAQLQVARKAYQDAQESVLNLNTLESSAEQRMWESKQGMEKKILALREEGANTVLFFVSGMYLVLVGTLAIVTKSFASPIRKLAAAKNSIDHNKPFNLAESGPYEIRSVTKSSGV